MAAPGENPVPAGGQHEPSVQEMLAFAHAVQPALRMLDVVANQPVQGEAMHKVIGYHAAQALVQVGWRNDQGRMCYGHDHHHPLDGIEWCEPVYVIRDPSAAARQDEVR